LFLILCTSRGPAAEVDTEHLFGFTFGSSIGEKGEKELESETTLRAAKGSGTYAALAQQSKPSTRLKVGSAPPPRQFSPTTI